MQKKSDVAGWYAGKRVLITGAGGFVGGALAKKLLSYGAKVWAVVRDVDRTAPFHGWDIWPQYIESILCGDLTNYNFIERAMAESEPDVVFHLAAM